MHANLAESDDVRVVRTGELLVLGYFSQVATGDDDHAMIERGFMVYDALFAWSRHAAEERHNWPAKAA